MSARILAAAREAVVTPPGFVERWLAGWPGHAAAGALGTVVIAGFVGLMWQAARRPRRPGHEREP